MNIKLLVNTPEKLQELIEIDELGNYFDSSRVIWDERIDGIFPSDKMSEIGGLIKNGNALIFNQDLFDTDISIKDDVDMVELKAKRDLFIQKTDWTQLIDVVPSGRLAAEEQVDWATYRQQLADFPTTIDVIADAVWPTPPAFPIVSGVND